MNDLVNIAAMQIAGSVNTPQAQGKALGQGELGNFLSHLSKQLQATETSGQVVKTPSAEKVTPTEVTELSEKIAALLKAEKILPDQLANLSLKELTVQIENILQQGEMLPASFKQMPLPEITTKITELLEASTDDTADVKTSLLHDIAAKFSLQTNEANTAEEKETSVKVQLANILKEDINQKPEVDMSKATEIISKLETGAEKETTINDILLQLHAEAKDIGAELDPEILEQLASKIEATLSNNTQEITPEALGELKQNILQELQSQGLDPDTIDKYLVALSKDLKSENKPVELVDIKNTPAKEIKDIILGNKDISTQPKAEKIELNKAPQHQSILPTEEVLPQKSESTNTQSSITSKVSGMSINPQTINAIAGQDSNTPDLLQGNNTPTQNLSESAALLKTEATNTQNFANYISEAKETASKTTQMVNLQLQRNVNAKVTSMKIQLVPHDLGKLDIELNFATDGTIKAHLIAEKPETLVMLQKDAHFLEKTLQDAGLSTDKDSLSFDLKQQNPQQQNLDGYKNENNNNNEFASHIEGVDAAHELLQAQIAIEAMGYQTQTGINITV